MFEDYGEFTTFAWVIAAGRDIVCCVIEQPLGLSKQDTQLTVDRIDHGDYLQPVGRPACGERALAFGGGRSDPGFAPDSALGVGVPTFPG